MSIQAKEPVRLTNSEAQQALASSRELAPYLRQRRGLHLQIQSGKRKAASLPLSPKVLRVIHDVLARLADGEAISVLSHDTELTTQEAANLLNVSRPFLINLLDQKLIPSRKVGTHRRVLFKDVLKYQRASYPHSQQALDELAKEAQSLNMGY